MKVEFCRPAVPCTYVYESPNAILLAISIDHGSSHFQGSLHMLRVVPVELGLLLGCGHPH